MQSDANPPPADADVVADLCIVGAGPAGISIARELAGSDISICLLDSGGKNIEGRIQRQSRGQSDGYPIHQPHRSRLRVFGGTLRHPEIWDEGWAARPLDPIDFEARPGRPDSGWPFDREHLDSYYARAQPACGLATCDYQSGVWPDSSQSEALSMDGSDVDTTVFQFGKPSFHQAYEQLSTSPNIRLLLHSRVVDITVDPRDRRVKEVVVRRDDGSRFVVRARVVVLATGGIENARLLLAADHLRGLGNDHDVVGRYFAERLSLHAGHITPAHPSLVDKATFFHHVDNALVCGALRVADQVQRDHQLLNCAFFVVPRPEPVTTDAVRSLATLRKAAIRRPLITRPAKHVANVLTGLGDLGRLAANRLRSTPLILAVRAQAEQTPNRESRITLGTRRDDLGVPVARITWHFDESDRTSIQSSMKILDAELRARRFGSVTGTVADQDPATLMEGNHHHLGTTRMHVDPRKGVVDHNCRVHSVPNLYVAGCSVFPTYGASNPTLTIVAMAIRLADHLRAELKRR